MEVDLLTCSFANRFSRVRKRDKYDSNYGMAMPKFSRHHICRYSRNPFNSRGEIALKSSKFTSRAVYCNAQLPDIGIGGQIRYFMENTDFKLEKAIADSLVNGEKLVENLAVSFGNSASILLQKVSIDMNHFGGGQNVLELGHSLLNVSDRLHVLITYLSSQLGNISVDDQQKLYYAIAGQIGSALGIYSSELRIVSTSAASLPIAAAAALVAVVGSSVVTVNKTSEEKDTLPLRYDPEAIAAYFKKRPLAVVSRLLEVILDCSYFALGLAIDSATSTVKENEKQRAAEFVDLITKLGPTTIKIGQALSIRPDILPVAYLEELQKLQDKVPPFCNEVAKHLIEEGLGRPVEEVLTELSSEPVAAASLGQVYRGTLREEGEMVALKVQRPGVLEGISRDLFLLRNAAQALQPLPYIQSDLVALLDNWAFRFFDELDYVQEGKNAEQFAENMKSIPNIKVPRVFMKYTSRKVLINEWVAGEKLSESREEDLLLLVNTALNCYLIQLLESGFLHADPHPGNLLRTADGCLCVLDFGLMTEVTEEQRYTFLEYISHLFNSDYEKVAEDLVRLGFVPPELVDPVKTAEVVPQISRILGQLRQGGGARKINVQQVTDDLAKMAEDYVFVIPPYFALILKAFSVLEGIGLEADPDYAIINGCYPYLSKRLITDDSPRARAALKYFLYGENDRLDVKRVEDILDGFETFQKLTMVPTTADNSGKSVPPVDPAAKEVLLLVFAPNGSFLQDVLLIELVRAVDALSREALAELWGFFVSQALFPLPPELSAPKSWLMPLPSLFFGSRRIASLSQEDEYSLDTVKRLWVLAEPQFRQTTFVSGISELVQGVIPVMPDLFPGIVMATQRFILMLLQRQALRLADDLDGNNSIVVWERDPTAFARHVRSIQLPMRHR